MASAGLLSLLDDIASVLDDVAVMAKLATKKTMAIAGDDLAVGAEAMVGLHPKRELPIVWAVAKGALLNKVILVPIILLLTLVAPWSLTPLLMLGGAFLCYEGVHKGLEKLGMVEHHEETAAAQALTPAELERKKIRGAVRTDLILSAEIVVIALNAITAENPSFGTKALTLSLVALGITVAIYGLIALIVKADDAGLSLLKRGGALKLLGRGILFVMPRFMKTLGVLGTIAMFIVGGEIIAHGLPGLDHHWLEHLVEGATTAEPWYSILKTAAVIVFGIIVGFLVVGLVKLVGPVVGPLVARIKARFTKRTA